MDVHLLVYDLSGGLARQMSAGLLGFHLDAIYHTSIQLNGLEYVYDGGIVAIRPGSSHLGQPLRKVHLGISQLPMEIVEEYLDSLREIYTIQAYDLWRHNCNNFSNDFATFLVGRGIPDYIINMPSSVLESPLGQMLLPMLDQQINAARRGRAILGIQNSPEGANHERDSPVQCHTGAALTANNGRELASILDATKKSCAVVFFTSVGCRPCQMLYSLYDELAKEAGRRGTLIKADVSAASHITLPLPIRITPTFITYLHGREHNRWSGSDPTALRRNVHQVIQLSWPPHQHRSLNLPNISKQEIKPVLFTKVPPLPKLLGKMGSIAEEPAIKALANFIETRSTDGASHAHLPDIAAISSLILGQLRSALPDIMFPIADLLRCAVADPRFSGCLAEDKHHRVVAGLFDYVNRLEECPYPLRLVTLQLSSNLFSSPLYWDQLIGNSRLTAAVVTLISSSFLDDAHTAVRVAAASALFNLAITNGRGRREEQSDILPEDAQIALAASVLEAISHETKSRDALEGMLLALGHLVYCLPPESGIADLMKTLDAKGIIMKKKGIFEDMPLVEEVGSELLGQVRHIKLES